MRWLRKFGVTETILAASIVAALVLFFVLGAMSGADGNLGAWVNYYGHSLAGSFSGFFYGVMLFVCLAAMALVIWSLGGGFLAIIFPKWRIWRAVRGGRPGDGKNIADNTPRDIFIMALKRSREMLLILPAILFVTIAALAMGEANRFALARLKDGMVIGYEHALFGNYVFAALGAVQYPHWLIASIIFSFENMALGLIIASVILSYIARDRFRELLVAFCVGILVMIPIWLMIPALSPQDRFIDNVYALPMPSQIAIAVANYHPQPEIVAFLQSIRNGKADLPAMPTSTFPSAHVFWATLAGYYLFRAKTWRRWLGWIALPFLLASTFGTVLLAQHYFIDVPAGLAVAAFAIWLAHDITSSASHGTHDAPHEAVYR